MSPAQKGERLLKLEAVQTIIPEDGPVCRERILFERCFLQPDKRHTHVTIISMNVEYGNIIEYYRQTFDLPVSPIATRTRLLVKNL